MTEQLYRPAARTRLTPWTVGVVVVLLVVGWWGWNAFHLRTTAEDGRRLAQLEADPVVAVEPPGAVRTETITRQAGTRAFAASSSSTVVLVAWDLRPDADLAGAVRDLADRVVEAGWTFAAEDEPRCGSERVSARARKDNGGWTAMIDVSARADADGPVLAMSLRAPHAGDDGEPVPAGPPDAGLRGSCLDAP